MKFRSCINQNEKLLVVNMFIGALLQILLTDIISPPNSNNSTKNEWKKERREAKKKARKLLVIEEKRKMKRSSSVCFFFCFVFLIIFFLVCLLLPFLWTCSFSLPSVSTNFLSVKFAVTKAAHSSADFLATFVFEFPLYQIPSFTRFQESSNDLIYSSLVETRRISFVLLYSCGI